MHEFWCFLQQFMVSGPLVPIPGRKGAHRKHMKSTRSCLRLNLSLNTVRSVRIILSLKPQIEMQEIHEYYIYIYIDV